MCGSTAASTIGLAELRPLKNLTERNKMYKKTTTVEEYFDTAPTPVVPPMQAPRSINPKALKPVIRLDVPLMIRLLEYAREGAGSDTELHLMVERMMELCEYGEVLEMDDYEDIVETVITPTPSPIVVPPPTTVA